jgi:hypothetical protein
MVWTIVIVAILSAIVIAGRAHSRRLDMEEARWTPKAPPLRQPVVEKGTIKEREVRTSWGISQV